MIQTFLFDLGPKVLHIILSPSSPSPSFPFILLFSPIPSHDLIFPRPLSFFYFPPFLLMLFFPSHPFSCSSFLPIPYHALLSFPSLLMLFFPSHPFSCSSFLPIPFSCSSFLPIPSLFLFPKFFVP